MSGAKANQEGIGAATATIVVTVRMARAEQCEREDDEARQVTVERARSAPPEIAVRTPAAYPIKWVDAQLTHRSGTNLGILPLGHAGSEPAVQDGYTRYYFPAAVPLLRSGQHSSSGSSTGTANLYYNYLSQTRRFPQKTDWITAAVEIDQWIRTGPGPDEPVA